MRFITVGYGKVGRPFSLGLRQSGADCAGIVLRSGDDDDRRQAKQDGFTLLEPGFVPGAVDIVALAVPDTVISEIATQIAERMKPTGGSDFARAKPVFLHFAGRYGCGPLAAPAEKGYGVIAWHPVQTFIPGVGAERFRGIRAGVTCKRDLLPLAAEIGRRLGAWVSFVPENDRPRYHHACVLAANFLPLLMDLAVKRLHGLVDSERETVDMLLPLVRGMVENLEHHPPGEAITGPVPRNDLEAVRSHLAGWNDSAGGEVYRMLTDGLVRLAREHGLMTAEQADRWEQMLRSNKENRR